MANITSFVKSLLPNLERDTVIEDCRTALAQFEQNVVPTYQSCEKLFASLKFKSSDSLFLQSQARLAFHDLKNQNLIAYVSKGLPQIVESVQHAMAIAENNFQSDIMPNAVTFRQAYVLRLIEMASFVSSYMLDLLDYVYVAETSELSEDESGVAPLAPAKKKYIEEKFGSFTSCYNVLTGKPNELPKLVNAVPDVVITPSNESSMNHTVGLKSMDPLNLGYINAKLNPVYYIRMRIAEYQASKYKKAKEQRRILQYRMLDLKHRLDGKNDASLQKQITVTAERIDKYDYEIAEMERRYE